MIPLRHAKWTYAWTLALLFYYLSTMSLGLSLYDSPALALVGEQLGLSHPIGQPLHTILAFVGSSFANIVGMEPLIATNALSALSGALILPSVCSIGENLIEGRTTRHSAGLWLAPVVALGGTHIALWEPATRIEVYALATCLGFWGVARLVHAFESPENDAPNMWLTGLLFGLSAASHAHVALALAIACNAALYLGRHPPRGSPERDRKGCRRWFARSPRLSICPADRSASRRRDNMGTPRRLGKPEALFFRRRLPSEQADHACFVHRSPQAMADLVHRKGSPVFLTARLCRLWSLRPAARRGTFPFFLQCSPTYSVLSSPTPSSRPDILDYLEYLMPSFWIAALGLGLLAVYAANKHPLWASIVAGITIGLVFFSSPSPLSHAHGIWTTLRENSPMPRSWTRPRTPS